MHAHLSELWTFSVILALETSLFPSNFVPYIVVANVGGHCLLGKIPLELLHLSWEKSQNLSTGDRAEMLSTVDLQSCFMKVC